MVKASLKTAPGTSVRQIPTKTALSFNSVHMILRNNLKMLPHEGKTNHEMLEQRKRGRITFSQWLLEQEGFVVRVHWSDEKLWTEQGKVNKQNERYLAVSTLGWRLT